MTIIRLRCTLRTVVVVLRVFLLQASFSCSGPFRVVSYVNLSLLSDTPFSM